MSADEAPRAYLDALGDRVVHLHLRDTVPGNIHRSIGDGPIDVRALISPSQKKATAVTAATARASDYITNLLSTLYA